MTFTVYICEGDFTNNDPFAGTIKLRGVSANDAECLYNLIKKYGGANVYDFVLRPESGE